MLVGTLPSAIAITQHFLTMSLLAFIMIQVGREFEVDLKNPRKYAVDYGVAATAAAFPWIFVSIYFLMFLMPEVTPELRPQWIEALLVGRFAAPTSAGVLFSMLAASGLAGTWVYNKTRVLAIFDDLDTVLLMIPLQMLIVGFVWQLGGVILAYSVIMVAISEVLYAYTKDPVTKVGLHIEILLPAFLLGCVLRHEPHEHALVPGENPAGLGSEERAGVVVSGAFMLLVGLTMPAAFGEHAAIKSNLSPWMLATHVLAVTLLANLGKMFACLCYRNEASLRERLAVSVAMFPRGEVGAGVLAVSLGYGIQGPLVTVAFMSLALNLVLTGGFIYGVKRLLRQGLGELLRSIYSSELVVCLWSSARGPIVTIFLRPAVL